MVNNLNEIFSPHLIKIIHYTVSVTFLIFAIALTIRSVLGIKNKLTYTRLDKFLSIGFIINLYLQLVLGLFLFTNLGTGADYNYLASGSSDMVSKRLWPVEHIVLMLFALFIANLGLIFSIQTKNSLGKFKNILILIVINRVFVLLMVVSFLVQISDY